MDERKRERESLLTKISLVSRGISQSVNNDTVVDTSDKFALIAVFLSSVVLTYLFENSTEFVPKYSFMLQCTDSKGFETYEATAEDATKYGASILYFTLAYLLVWITFRILNPDGMLKLCLLLCLLLYGLCGLASALYYCAEIIVVMAVRTDLDCTVSRYGSRIKTSHTLLILAPVLLAALPIAHRIYHLLHHFLNEGRRAPVAPRSLKATANRIRVAHRIANTATAANAHPLSSV